MARRDYYEILGLHQKAGVEDIKRAYRKLAMEHHPDRRPGDRASEELFREAAEAYEILGDPEKRRLYDRYGHDGLNGSGFTEFTRPEDILSRFSDLFAEFFSRPRRSGYAGPVPGDDIRIDLAVEFSDAATGKEAEIRFSRDEDCRVCGGTGSETGARKICPACQGLGQIFQTSGAFHVSSTCRECRGEGEILVDPCPQCHGRGRVDEMRTVSVRVPPGVTTGTKLRLRGEGRAGFHGGPPGDMYVVVYVKPSEIFERDGRHIYYTADVSMVQATLGAEITVPTLFGETRLTVPPGTQYGDVLTLEEEGFPILRGTGRGNMYVEIKVEVPTGLTTRQIELLREFEGKPVPQRLVKQTWMDRLANALRTVVSWRTN